MPAALSLITNGSKTTTAATSQVTNSVTLTNSLEHRLIAIATGAGATINTPTCAGWTGLSPSSHYEGGQNYNITEFRKTASGAESPGTFTVDYGGQTQVEIYTIILAAASVVTGAGSLVQLVGGVEPSDGASTGLTITLANLGDAVNDLTLLTVICNTENPTLEGGYTSIVDLHSTSYVRCCYKVGLDLSPSVTNSVFKDVIGLAEQLAAVVVVVGGAPRIPPTSQAVSRSAVM